MTLLCLLGWDHPTGGIKYKKNELLTLISTIELMRKSNVTLLYAKYHTHTIAAEGVGRRKAVEAPIPVVAHTSYRAMNRGFAVLTSVLLRTGGVECKGYKIPVQTKVSHGDIKAINVTLFEKFLLGAGQEGTCDPGSRIL
jgi:hypothetical protein